MEYEILKTEGRAKRARVSTVHGEIQTPVFMNVGTVAAIKGAVSTMDLKEIGTQVVAYIPRSADIQTAEAGGGTVFEQLSSSPMHGVYRKLADCVLSMSQDIVKESPEEYVF